MSLALNIYDDLKIRLGTPDDMREVMDLAIAAAKENGLVNASQVLLAKTVWPALCQAAMTSACGAWNSISRASGSWAPILRNA